MLILQLSDIEKQYERAHKQTEQAVSFTLHVSHLTIEEGEFFAILGPSGCGKTTLLKIIAGLIQPDQGMVSYGSKIMNSIPPEKREVGMVFQQPLLFPHMTVLDNVAFGLKMQGVDKQTRQRKARDMLASAGLEGYINRYPSQLSGGQQQRVSLARAIVSGSRLLLMDEPFSALDPGLREEMRDLVRQLQKEHKVTILLVTHDREEAIMLANRIGLMKNGRFLQVGPPSDLYQYPNDPEVALFMGAKNVFPGEMLNGMFAGEDLQVKLPDNGENIRIQGWLILRPEILQMTSETISENDMDIRLRKNMHYMQGIVRDVSFRHGFYSVQVEVGGMELEVIEKFIQKGPPKPGELVTLKFDIHHSHFIAASGEGI